MGPGAEPRRGRTPSPRGASHTSIGAGLRRKPLVAELLTRCLFPATGTAVVCGVSGGADSLTLMVLAVAADLQVTAVHVDHGQRPGSAAEAESVAAATTTFGVRFDARTVTVEPGSNLEARMRVARLDALGPTALLGHTADDQAETLLINLARGAGPAGLAAMAPGGRHPILRLRRSETRRLCDEIGLVPIADPSNEDPRFVRNRVRHELLPLLADIAERDPVPLLVRTADHTRALVRGIDAMAAELDVESTADLRSAPSVVARAALRTWLRDAAGHPPSSAELDRVWEVVEQRVRACELAGGRRVSRTRGRLRVEPPPGESKTASDDSLPDEGSGSVA